MKVIAQFSFQSKFTKGAFTLIELLVVIAIIALLAAILFPVFARARENARRSSCLSNMKQISLGIMQYTQDYDERLPASGHMLKRQNGQSDDNMEHSGNFHQVIQPYIKNRQVFACPSNQKNSVLIDQSKNTWAGETYPLGFPVSYMANALATGNAYWAASGTPMTVLTSKTQTTKVLSQLVTPSQSIMLFENCGTSKKPDMWDNTDIGSGKVVLTDHLKMSNFLFADGHVKSMKPIATIVGANMWSNDAQDVVPSGMTTRIRTLQKDLDE